MENTDSNNFGAGNTAITFLKSESNSKTDNLTNSKKIASGTGGGLKTNHSTSKQKNVKFSR